MNCVLGIMIDHSGYISKDRNNRSIYFVMEDDGEVYRVTEPEFRQFLTRFARGCKLSEIDGLVLTEEAEVLK